MTKPLSVPRSQFLATIIVIIILCGVLICCLIILSFYLQRRRQQEVGEDGTTNTLSNSRESRLSKLTPETSQQSNNSEPGGSSERAYMGINTAERLPRLELNEVLVDSVHPSVYSDFLNRSHHPPNPSNLGTCASVAEESEGFRPSMEEFETLFLDHQTDAQHKNQSNDRHLSSIKITQPTGLEPRTVVRLPQTSFESVEQTDKRNQIYNSFKDQASNSSGALIEMSPVNCELPLSSVTDSTRTKDRFYEPKRNGDQALSNMMSRDLRIVSSSILQTTEKKKPGQLLKEKLLGFISTSSHNNPELNREDSGESEVKYYWEMLQVESNDNWWQLPFPPQLSPLEPDFKFLDDQTHISG